MIGKNGEAEIASHDCGTSQDPNQSAPIHDLSRHSSPSPDSLADTKTKRRRLDDTEPSITTLKTTFEQEAGNSMNSASSMQTPPPTSTSTSRRKSQHAQVARFVKESGEKGRRMSFPALAKMDNAEASTSQVDNSPQHFSALQFSPEAFGIQASGPATAPVYPQNKLFWDPEQSVDNMNLDLSLDDTFTSFSAQKALDPFISNHDGPTIDFPTSPAVNLLGANNENTAPFTTSTHIDSLGRSSSTAMARKPSRGNGVDPSLLFSSPGHASEASSMPSMSQRIQDDNLLPYAHQLRDAQMELETQMARKPKRKRCPETDSPAVKAALQTLRDDQSGFKRDLADNSSTSSVTQRPSSRTSLGRSKQRPVPLNSTVRGQRNTGQLQISQKEVPSHKRTSVTLTIDASGRAKTETKVIADEGKHSESALEMDSDRDSDSSSSSSHDEMVMSQTQSFAYPKVQKQPKMGRFTHKSHSHSQKSSYASTVASSSRPHADSESNMARSSSKLFDQPVVRNPNPRASLNAYDRDDESEAETIIDSDDDRGDAQSALKKALESRQNKRSQHPHGSQARNSYIENQDIYPSRRALPHPYYSIESRTPHHNGYKQPHNNTSPTTITDPDLATPSSGRSTFSSDAVRCVCHTTDDDGQLMVQW